MPATLIQTLANFADETTFDMLPAVVVEESKRAILDSIGCALGAVDEPKGRAGIEYGRIMGGENGAATIIGSGDRVSMFGAAFANGELINTLDMDAILPPGHVSPYVLPGAMALGEASASSGKNMLAAVAVAHEMSNRIGKAMDNLRDTKDGKVSPPAVFGYSSTIFGATAAIGKLQGQSSAKLANSLGIAAYISPVNPQMAWFQHAPSSTIKYLVAGMLAQQAFNAAFMGQLGHRGDRQVLDDREFGYPRFIGTNRWDFDRIVAELGTKWFFPAEQSFKPYPHCRIMHAMLDCVIKIVRENDLKPAEIEHIKVYIEGFAERPVWLNRVVETGHDAQFSMAHGISVAAHLVPPGKAWMDPKVIHDPSILSLMDRIETQVHPDYVKLLTGNAASRPARVELRARGKTIIEEKRYPKGSPSPESDSAMTNDELIQKFRHNAEGVLSAANADGVVNEVMALEAVSDFGRIMRMSGNAQASRSTARHASIAAQ